MRKIKKGDEVVIIAGKDKGKKGRILSIVNGGERVVVEGLNMVKKTVKADPNKGVSGGLVPKEMSIHRSNVMLCDQNNKPSRVGIRILKDGEKVRYFKTTDQLVTEQTTGRQS